MLNPRDFKTCFGISSKCEDNKHIVFIDSDNKSYSDFVKDLLFLQNEWEISDIYILQTENGYNAFCLEKFEFNYILRMLDDIDSSCKDHLRIGEKRGYLVLRMSHDKKIISILPKTTKIENLLSLSHYLFFTNIMGYELLNYDTINFDNLLKFDVVAYYSKKHGIENVRIDVPIDEAPDEEFSYERR